LAGCPAVKGDTVSQSNAQPHAIHLTPSQGPPLVVVFQEHIDKGQTSASVPSTTPPAELRGPEYDYLLKNLRAQLRELSPSPNRSLEWPLTLGARRQVSHLSSYRQSPQWGPQAKSASGCILVVSFQRSPIKTRHRAFFAFTNNSGAAVQALGAFMVAMRSFNSLV
jgi:hypothetical protein